MEGLQLVFLASCLVILTLTPLCEAIPLICTSERMIKVIEDCSRSLAIDEQEDARLLTGINDCKRISSLIVCLEDPLKNIQKECPEENQKILKMALEQAYRQLNQTCNDTEIIQVLSCSLILFRLRKIIEICYLRFCFLQLSFLMLFLIFIFYFIITL